MAVGRRGPLGTRSFRPAGLLIQLEMRVGVIRDEGGGGERGRASRRESPGQSGRCRRVRMNKGGRKGVED